MGVVLRISAELWSEFVYGRTELAWDQAGNPSDPALTISIEWRQLRWPAGHIPLVRTRLGCP